MERHSKRAKNYLSLLDRLNLLYKDCEALDPNGNAPYLCNHLADALLILHHLTQEALKDALTNLKNEYPTPRK